MAIIDNEEQIDIYLISDLSASTNQPFVPNNKSLVSELTACMIQLSSTTLVVPTPSSSPAAANGVTFDPPMHANVATVAQAFLETNVKLQRILKK